MGEYDYFAGRPGHEGSAPVGPPAEPMPTPSPFGTPVGSSFGALPVDAASAGPNGLLVGAPQRTGVTRRWRPRIVDVTTLVLRVEGWLYLVGALGLFGLSLLLLAGSGGSDPADPGTQASYAALGPVLVLAVQGAIILKVASSFGEGRRWAAVLVLLGGLAGCAVVVAALVGGFDPYAMDDGTGSSAGATGGASSSDPGLSDPWTIAILGVVGALSALQVLAVLWPPSFTWFFGRRVRRR